MSVTLTGTGGLFTRLGRIFFAVKSANLYLGSTDISSGGLKAVGVSATDIEAQFQSALQNEVDALFANRDAARGQLTNWKNYLKTLAANTVIDQVNADTSLPSKDITTALVELFRQMIGSGSVYSPDNSVAAPTVSVSTGTVTGVTNVGNGAIGASLLRADARTTYLAYPETFQVQCVGDANSGATARSETWTAAAPVAASDLLGYDWPLGSGKTASLTCVDADKNNSGNLLYNSNFEAFTVANQPDYWGTPLVGSSGTDILSESSTTYRTGKSLRFLGTGGSPLSSIAQVFGQTPAVGSSGTSYVLKPSTVYAFNCWARKSASAAAGVLNVRLIDSSNATMTDDAGTSLSSTVAVGSLSSAAWTAFTGFFVTPHTVIPTGTYKLNVRVSTAVTSGESIYVDDLSFCEAKSLYAGGPWAAIFAGSTNFLRGDRLTITSSNNRGGAFTEWFDRAFDLKAKGLQVPTSGSPTINDNLVA